MRSDVKADRRLRGVRTAVWVVGALLGAVLFVTLTMATWGTVVPAWAGIVVVIGALMCGDLAERSWQRLSRQSAA